MQELEVVVWCKFDTRRGCYVARTEVFEAVEGLGHTPHDAMQQLTEAVYLYLKLTRHPVPVQMLFRPM